MLTDCHRARLSDDRGRDAAEGVKRWCEEVVTVPGVGRRGDQGELGFVDRVANADAEDGDAGVVGLLSGGDRVSGVFC